MSKKKSRPEEVLAREQEILSRPVRTDGVGEDPAVRAMLSETFTEGTNTEALDIALAMQQLLKGQASLLENDRKFSEELQHMRAKMAKIDEDAQRFEQDRERWLNEIQAAADKMRVSEEQVEKLKAVAANDLAAKIQAAKASVSLDRQAFDDALAHEPKETITSPGIVEIVMQNGAPVAQLFNEEIRIKHRRWVLRPGVPVEVPHSVAEMYRNRKRSEQETAERQKAMMANMESSKLAERMKEIDNQFGSSTAHLGES